MAPSRPASRAALTVAAAAVLLVSNGVWAVDRSKFKTCDTSSFCKRHRHRTTEPELRVLPASVALSGGDITASMHSDAPGAPPFRLVVHIYESGVARVKIMEVNDLPPRWEVRVVPVALVRLFVCRGVTYTHTRVVTGKQTRVVCSSRSELTPPHLCSACLCVRTSHSYPPTLQPADVLVQSGLKPVAGARLLVAGSATDASAVAAFTGGPPAAGTSYVTYTSGGPSGTNYTAGTSVLLALHHAPFRVQLFVAGSGSTAPAISVGERGLVYFEHRRKREAAGDAAGAGAAAEHTRVDRKILSWGEDGKPIYEGGGDEGMSDGGANDGRGKAAASVKGEGAASAPLPFIRPRS